MKALAYKWAVELIRPELRYIIFKKTNLLKQENNLFYLNYRKELDEKYKAKIENIARRPVKEEIEENKSECPFCKVKLNYLF